MTDSVLRKKLKVPETKNRSGPPLDCGESFEKAVSLTGLNLLDIQMEASASPSETHMPARLISNLFDHGLNLLITGRNTPFLGMICLNPELIASITDALTGSMGDPKPSAPILRAPTPTDAALCANFINGILTEVDKVFVKKNPAFLPIGFRISSQVADPSAHLFPDIPHTFLTVALDIADGKRNGNFSIAVPSGAWGKARADDPVTQVTRPDPIWQAALQGSVIAAQTHLQAVLHRKKMSIGSIMKLKKGDMIDIPATALDSLRLESRQDGKTKEIMVARLGEYQEMRAARVLRIGPAKTMPAQPELLSAAP